MRNFIINISMFMLLLAMSRCKQEPSERNNIRFKDPVKVVEERLKQMNKLLDKVIPIEGESRNYFFDYKGNFYVNSRKLGPFRSLDLNRSEMFKSLSSSEKREFLNTVKILNDNYLTSGYLDEPSKCYLYDYHQLDDPSFNEVRRIFIGEDKSKYATLLVESKVLDKKGNLVLIGADNSRK